MSHHLDFDSISQTCILLQHLSAGSKQYCADRNIGGELDIGDAEFDEYWGWIKSLVSSYILSSAIKIRVIQDTTKGKEDIINLEKLDALACNSIDLGVVKQGTFNLTLRESCNKIIHATNVSPLWTENKNGADCLYKYWSGKVEMSGSYNQKPWSLELHVDKWAKAIESFIILLKSSDAFHYIGQDWY